MSSKFKAYLLSVLSGLLLAFSNAPFDLAFLAWVALVPLFLAVRGKSLKDTLVLFVSTGSIFSAAIYNGAAAAGLLFFFTIVLIVSVDFAVFGLLQYAVFKRFQNGFVQVFLPAIVWTAIEQINANTIIKIPVHLGLSQNIHPMLIQSASIGGIFAVSFLVVLVNSAIAFLLHAFMEQNREGKAFPELAPKLAAPVVALLLFGANWGYGSWVLHQPIASNTTIKVATLQPLIESQIYENAWIRKENRKLLRDRFAELTEEAIRTGPQMIFWPEDGNGFYNMRIPVLRNAIFRMAKENHMAFILGSRDLDEHGEMFNSIFSVSDEGTLLGRYDKNYLVPFTEHYTSGREYSVLQTSQGRMAPAICFESILPSVLRRGTKQGAKFLFVSVSDASTRTSSLAMHHARLSVFRAVENGRYLVRAANTGPSMIIDPYGRVLKQSAFYKKGIMTGEIKLLDSLTPFTRFGFLFGWINVLIAVIVSGYLLATRTKSTAPAKAPAPGKKKVTGKQTNPELVLTRWKTRITSPATLHLTTSIGLHSILFIGMIVGSLAIVNVKAGLGMSISDAVRNVLPIRQNKPENISEQFMQAKSNTCGPAALAYLLSFYGQETTEADVMQHVNLQENGSSMLDLAGAANALGFDTQGWRQNYAALMKESLPVIAYINNNHYVVVNQVASNELILFDPAIGHASVPRWVFAKMWNGYVLLIRMKPISQSLDAIPDTTS